MKRCDICRGAGRVNLPVYNPVQAVELDTSQTSRKYPCPECGDYAEVCTLQVVERADGLAKVKDVSRLQKTFMADAMARKLLADNFICFKLIGNEDNPFMALRARLRVARPNSMKE